MTATTPIDPDATLASLVDANPALARELEHRSLDYCCGGGRSLTDACRDAGIDPVATAAELAAVTHHDVADWVELGPAELVDHLETTHHAYLHAELPRLSALVDKVTGAHGARHPELVEVQATMQALRADLEPHLAKEEGVLFPMIRELAAATTLPRLHCGSVRNPISVMLAEHDRAGDLLATLRRLTDGFHPPADGCPSYRALYEALAELESDIHLHVHKENNVLFPAVVQLEGELAP